MKQHGTCRVPETPPTTERDVRAFDLRSDMPSRRAARVTRSRSLQVAGHGGVEVPFTVAGGPHFLATQRAAHVPEMGRDPHGGTGRRGRRWGGLKDGL